MLVTIGIPKLPLRRSYFLWKEGRPPSMVIEITSESSRREDQDKKEVYARIGVAEYFLADPLGEYLKPPLQGFRLDGSQYRPIRPEADGSLMSEATGLRLTRETEGKIRLRDAVTGEWLLRPNEMAEKLARLRRKLEGLSE